MLLLWLVLTTTPWVWCLCVTICLLHTFFFSQWYYVCWPRFNKTNDLARGVNLRPVTVRLLSGQRAMWSIPPSADSVSESVKAEETKKTKASSVLLKGAINEMPFYKCLHTNMKLWQSVTSPRLGCREAFIPHQGHLKRVSALWCWKATEGEKLCSKQR